MVAARASAEDVPLPELLERAQRGDGDAFGELYRRFSRRVFGLCLHLLRGRADAEDASTEVFLKLRAALSGDDRPLPLHAWLTTVATNHCLDRLRRRRREGRLFASEPDPAVEWPSENHSPLAEVLEEERRRVVAAALAALPDRYRVPLALRYYGELSYDEIAARLGQTRQDVATSLFRAKQRLRQALAPDRDAS
jgi:RNA polymerase sigma-70 factor (ECF subfamily)